MTRPIGRQFTFAFGWLTILSLIGICLSVPLVNVLPIQDCESILHYSTGASIISFVCWAAIHLAILFSEPPVQPFVADEYIEEPQPQDEAPLDFMEEYLKRAGVNVPQLPDSIRDRHIQIIGKTGYGKSTLLSWWAFNDIIRGEGVCIIDPKGDLVDHLVRQIPSERLNDCIWTDIDNPLPLDFMSCQPGQEQSVVADLKYILTAGMLDTANAPTLNANIENLLYTLLNANANSQMPSHKKCTFLDVAEFFEDKDRQDFILSYVTDPRLKRCWKEPLPKADVSRILSRINPFVRNPTLAKIVGDPTPRLNMHDVIDQKKILLVRVPVINPSSAMYGALIVSKIQQAAFSRHRVQDRIPFFLYIDEFQNFRASEAFEKVLEMARGYKLCLTLANLKLGGLEPRVISALGIISSYVLFNLSPEDSYFYKPIIEDEDPNKDFRELAKREELKSDLQEWFSEEEVYRLTRLRQKSMSLPAPPITIKDALRLPKYKALYKFGDEKPLIAPIPLPGSPWSLTYQDECEEYIKFTSQKEYGMNSSFAESGTNRPVDNNACNSAPVPHNEGDDDEPQPGGRPNIPLH